jgi:hypothetical protein
VIFSRNHAELIHHKGEYYGGVERVKFRLSEPVFERKAMIEKLIFGSVSTCIRTNQNTEVSTSAKLEGSNGSIAPITVGQAFEEVN